MKAKELTLKSFRNYREQTVTFGDGINIFHGDNAQGKTNILEAVYMFSMGKANRAHKDAELIMHGEHSASLSLTFSEGDRISQGSIRLFDDRRKVISINDIPIRKNSELMGRFRVVYFGPEYLSLVKEGPSVRRKNTDIFISQLRPGYFSALTDARKIIDSKNALLKMERPNMAMLEILNEKLAAASAEVIFHRAAYLEKIGSLARNIQEDISGGKEQLTLKYQSCIGDGAGLDKEEIKARLLAKLTDAIRRETDLRESVIGPHREDMIYFINDKEAKLFASQGQQKTIVLVQKLAEVALMQEETRDTPVLLLDDIMSELDKKRQGYILNAIRDMQILITCTDTDGFLTDGLARLFHVENGTVVPSE